MFRSACIPNTCSTSHVYLRVTPDSGVNFPKEYTSSSEQTTFCVVYCVHIGCYGVASHKMKLTPDSGVNFETKCTIQRHFHPVARQQPTSTYIQWALDVPTSPQPCCVLVYSINDNIACCPSAIIHGVDALVLHRSMDHVGQGAVHGVCVDVCERDST